MPDSTQNAFEILEAFLRSSEPEVLGHETEIPKEIATRFSQLAHCELDRDAIRELSSVLKENPTWIRQLAEQIRNATT